jgi:8-oxo-dGTP pyrophosphatase MutT (NUDIX family)
MNGRPITVIPDEPSGALRGPLTYAETVDRLRVRLAGRQRRTIAADGFRPSAVAVLLVDRGGYPHLPLIVRPSDAPTHSGQIALPGGGRDPRDPSLIATALREAYEELGIDPERPGVLGELDDVPTPTRFVITPVVATLGAEPVHYVPSPREVAQMFEAPLHLFVDRSAAEDLGEREWEGMRYQLRAYQFGEHRIWGATARILEGLIDVML